MADEPGRWWDPLSTIGVAIVTALSTFAVTKMRLGKSHDLRAAAMFERRLEKVEQQNDACRRENDALRRENAELRAKLLDYESRLRSFEVQLAVLRKRIEKGGA